MAETIVLVRTHFVDAEIRALAASLHRPGEYRVAIAIDESGGPVDTAPFDKVSLTRERFAAMGLLEDLGDIFWRAGDYAFYCALDQFRDAPRFWMIEYDTAINRADPLSFLREIDAASRHDLLAPHFREPEDWWHFAEPLRGVYPRVMRCFYPLVRLSARAIRALLAERQRASAIQRGVPADQRMTWPNDEVFTATVLHDGGFACADFNDLGPFYSQGTFWFEPLRHPAHLPPDDGLLYHPVRGGAAYLRVVRAGDAVDPPVNLRDLVGLYPELEGDGVADLAGALLARSMAGKADDPERLLGAGSAARRLLEAMPTPAVMRAVVGQLASLRKPACLRWLRRHRAFEGWPHVEALDNLALGTPADQSSASRWSTSEEPRGDAAGGNDGRVEIEFGFHTEFEDGPFWGVDLGERVRLTGVWIYNRLVHWERLQGFEVLVSDDGAGWRVAYRCGEDDVGPSAAPIRVALGEEARCVRIRVSGHNALHLREVAVFGVGC